MLKKKTKDAPSQSESVSVKEYAQVLIEIKKQIQKTQIKLVLSANKELITFYWWMGETICQKQEKSGWGTKTIERLAKDLQNEYPGMAGFSRTNIFNMRAFYLAYEKIQQAAGQLDELPFFNIPWWHNVILFTKLKDNQQRIWYAHKAIEYGWSRSMLESWIKSDLYRREGKAITNFKATLPSPHSDMAQQSLKDPLIFDFLTLQKEHLERELEQGLIDHIQKFLLELGEGFAFVARQKHLHVGNKDYYIDLLFFHIKLQCYIVIELKAGEFEPRDAGQINFYLSAVDDLVKSPEHKPTIGLLLCKTKDNFTAEYALRNINSPIGIAGYETMLVESLPKDLKGSLPSVAEIEAELEKQEALIEDLAKKP
jgi:predicted nuclease of restriction endonuclease-like (RecB) superfamily